MIVDNEITQDGTEMYAVVDKSKTSNDKMKDKTGTSGATKDDYGMFYIACRLLCYAYVFHHYLFSVSPFPLSLFVSFFVHNNIYSSIPRL